MTSPSLSPSRKPAASRRDLAVAGACGAVVALMSLDYARRTLGGAGEYYGLLVLAVLGMVVMTSATLATAGKFDFFRSRLGLTQTELDFVVASVLQVGSTTNTGGIEVTEDIARAAGDQCCAAIRIQHQRSRRRDAGEPIGPRARQDAHAAHRSARCGAHDRGSTAAAAVRA